MPEKSVGKEPLPLKALLTGRVTPDKRQGIISWLNGVLHPDLMEPSPQWRIRQSTADPDVNLALEMLSNQYPEAAMRSPTLEVFPQLPYDTRAQRHRETGNIQLNPLELPDASAPELWDQKFLGLLDLLRHELAHGMGMGHYFDEPTRGRYGKPNAYDVGLASSRLHQDIALPPPPQKGKR